MPIPQKKLNILIIINQDLNTQLKEEHKEHLLHQFISRNKILITINITMPHRQTYLQIRSL